MNIILALLGGFMLGILFYSGLWLTVNKAMKSSWAKMIFMLSFLIRTVIVITGFCFLMGSNWKMALISLTAFMVGRMATNMITKKIKTPEIKRGSL